MRNISTPIALSACLALFGCGSDASAIDPDAAVIDGMPAPDAAPPGTITGSSIATYVTPTGEMDVPDDLSTTTIAALVPDGAGGFTTYPGTGNADGTFSIPDVPSGVTYYLQAGDYFYLVTDLREIDLGYAVTGRPGVEYAQTSPTNAVLNVDGMNAWTLPDQLNFFSHNANALYTLLDVDPETAEERLGEGAMAVDFTVDYWWADSPALIDSTQGDIAYLTHLEGVIDESDIQTQTLTQIATFTGIQQADGQSTAFTKTFEAVPQDESISLDVRFSEFVAQHESLPAPDVTISDAAIIAQPGGGEHGPLFGGSVLVDVSPPLVAAQDASVTTDYGNPFPDDWAVYGDAFHVQSQTYTAANGQAFFEFVYAGHSDALAGFTDGPVEPIVSPISAPTIDGEDATAAIDGVSETPTVTWTAAAGADGYVATLYHVVQTEQDAAREAVANFYTAGTTITLPPGLLVAGDQHYLKVVAYAQPNTDFEASPFRESFPFGYAESLTALFTVGDAASQRQPATQPTPTAYRVDDVRPDHRPRKPRPTF